MQRGNSGIEARISRQTSGSEIQAHDDNHSDFGSASFRSNESLYSALERIGAHPSFKVRSDSQVEGMMTDEVALGDGEPPIVLNVHQQGALVRLNQMIVGEEELTIEQALDTSVMDNVTPEEFEQRIAELAESRGQTVDHAVFDSIMDSLLPVVVEKAQEDEAQAADKEALDVEIEEREFLDQLERSKSVIETVEEDEKSGDSDETEQGGQPIVDETAEAAKPMNDETDEAAKPTDDETEETARSMNDETEEAAKPTDDETEGTARFMNDEPEEAAKPTDDETEERARSMNDETEEAAKPTHDETEKAARSMNGETKEAAKPTNDETEQAARSLNDETEEAARPMHGESEEAAKLMNGKSAETGDNAEHKHNQYETGEQENGEHETGKLEKGELENGENTEEASKIVEKEFDGNSARMKEAGEEEKVEFAGGTAEAGKKGGAKGICAMGGAIVIGVVVVSLTTVIRLVTARK